MSMKVETGVLHDQFPYVRVGEGRKQLAQRQQWRQLRGELATAAVDGAGAQRVARAFGTLFGGKAPTTADVAAFIALVDADWPTTPVLSSRGSMCQPS